MHEVGGYEGSTWVRAVVPHGGVALLKEPTQGLCSFIAFAVLKHRARAQRP